MSDASAADVLGLLEVWAATSWTVPPQDFFSAQVDTDALQESIEQARALGTEPGMTGHLVLKRSGWSGWWAADLHGIREVGCFPDTTDPLRLEGELRELLRFRATLLPADPFRWWQLHDYLVEVHVFGAAQGRPVLTVSVERRDPSTPSKSAT